MPAPSTFTHPKTETPKRDNSNSVRQRIVSGARRHFFSHGFRGVTMDDLAEELGMSKKTLYAHFRSKTKLVEAVVADKFTGVERDMDRITSADSADLSTTLRQLLACLQRHLQEIQPPFVRDVHRDAPETFKLVQNQRRKIFERHFGKVLAEGRRKGIIRKDISSGLMMKILLGILDSIMIPQKIVEMGLPPKTILSTIMTIFFQGVLTKRGRSKS